ncbi:hypothetical protein B0H10DRAFT_2203102 [Mycena sp. CBHHK59/15]|nr:hypothetical protein B0H10DRAFT_2203102 [Mycena sp. CBHHK59/15]
MYLTPTAADSEQKKAGHTVSYRLKLRCDLWDRCFASPQCCAACMWNALHHTRVRVAWDMVQVSTGDQFPPLIGKLLRIRGKKWGERLRGRQGNFGGFSGGGEHSTAVSSASMWVSVQRKRRGGGWVVAFNAISRHSRMPMLLNLYVLGATAVKLGKTRPGDRNTNRWRRASTGPFIGLEQCTVSVVGEALRMSEVQVEIPILTAR